MARLAHTYDCPDTNAIITDIPQFTVFSSEEANDVHIISTVQIKLPPVNADDGTAVFVFWRIEVEDELYNTYIWDDYNLADDVSKADMKTAIRSHLATYVRKLTISGSSIIDAYTDELSGNIVKKSTSSVFTAITDRGFGEKTA